MLLRSRRIFSVSVLCSSLAFSACGKDDKAKDAAAGAGPGPLGSWAQTCAKNESSWTTSINTYTATAISGVYKAYTKDGCAAADLFNTATFSGDYTVSGNKIDWSFTKITITPHTDASLAAYKITCASLTWAKDTETDVSTCDGFRKGIRKYFSIYKIEDSKLFVGKANGALDGSIDAKRPIEYDAENVMTKQ